MKAINWILAIISAGALAVCGYMGYTYINFPQGEYDAQVEQLQRETASVREGIEALSLEIAERDAAVQANLALAGERGAAAEKRLSELESALHEREETLQSTKEQVVFLENIYENTLALREEYGAKIRQLEEMILAGESDVKICYWSFDDGPTYYTQSVLDFCAEQGIYVTFFTSREANLNSSQDDRYIDMEIDLIRKEAMAGHSIQNHTNSHQYSLIAGNLYTKGIDSFREQVMLQDEWVFTHTGFKPDIFRFPGGSAHAFRGLPKDELLAVLDELGYSWIDWSCDIFDNGHNDPDVAEEVGNALYEIRIMGNRQGIAVMLSHDWNPNTVEAFKIVVPQLLQEGFIFLPLFSQSWAIGNTTIEFA